MYTIHHYGKPTLKSDSLVQAIWMAQMMGSGRIHSSYGDVIVMTQIGVLSTSNKFKKLQKPSSNLVMAIVAYLLSR